MSQNNLENNWGFLGLGRAAKGEGRRARELQDEHDEAFEGAGDIIVPEPEED